MLARNALIAGLSTYAIYAAVTFLPLPPGDADAAVNPNLTSQITIGVRLSQRELACLTQTVYGEVRGQSAAEIREVTGIILRRQRMGLWGSDLCRVVKSPKQFSCWNKNDPNRRAMARPERKAWGRVSRIVSQTLADGYVSPRSDYWHGKALRAATGRARPQWARACSGTRVIGGMTACRVRRG